MVKIALRTSDWIRLSDWETQREEWTRTRLTLQYHQVILVKYVQLLSVKYTYESFVLELHQFNFARSNRQSE